MTTPLKSTYPSALIQRFAPDADQNPAIARCLEAYQSSLQAAFEEGKGEIGAQFRGAKAYCLALPPLASPQQIRDFIACVTYGMGIGLISGPDGSRMLYGAQVASGALRAQPSAHTVLPQSSSRLKNKQRTSPDSIRQTESEHTPGGWGDEINGLVCGSVPS